MKINGVTISSGTSGSSGSSGTSGTSGINSFPVVEYATTNLVLGTADASEFLRVSATTTVTVSIPPQSAVTWASDTEILLEQRANGQLSLSGGSGVTLQYPDTNNAKTRRQYSVIALKRVSSNVWTVFGDLENL